MTRDEVPDDRREAAPFLGPHVVGTRVVIRRLVRGETGPSGGPAMTDVLGVCEVLGGRPGRRTTGEGATWSRSTPPTSSPASRCHPDRRGTTASTPWRRTGWRCPGWLPVESAPLGEWVLRASGQLQLAQWYPRVNVYDDVRGWNTEPYLGQGEFYLEYGDYTVEITVPSGYIVASTGTLTNPTAVLTPTQISRLAQAAKSATPVNIVTLDEIESGAARPKTSAPTLTWKFAAKNVRDVAWAASPEYLWDASSWNGILAQAYYRPSAVDPWKDAADQTRMSIEEYSTRWFKYPWPQMSAVEGPISGMEYPMLVMEAKSEDKYDLYNVVTHEIGHNWFPMLVGSNERVYMWQDEGFNTFINTFSEGRRYPEKGDQMARALGERQYVEAAMKANADKPIDVNPDRIDPRILGLAAYVKPSVGLQLLRQEIMGPEAFDDAFRTYIQRWAFKHPTPADFYPHDAGRGRQAARLVLARVVQGESALRPGDRHRRDAAAGRRAARGRRVRQPRARRAADPRALHLQRRLDGEVRLSRRGVEHEHDALRAAVRLPRQDAAQDRARPGQPARRPRPREQHRGRAGRPSGPKP